MELRLGYGQWGDPLLPFLSQQVESAARLSYCIEYTVTHDGLMYDL